MLYCYNKIEDATEKDIMNMRNYIKKGFGKVSRESIVDAIIATAVFGKQVFNKKTLLSVGVLLVVTGIVTIVMHKDSCLVSLGEEGAVQLSGSPLTAIGKKEIISIPQGVTKANPFLPYRDISGASTLSDVPAYTLVEPPEIVDENSEAARVMDTVVSGILYDKYSPSAILNIEGNDYLVKKGDVVNNYKVVSIMQDSVTVKLGSNVYKAGIGEILTEGSLNHNEVANLNNKFGGERR